MTICMKPLLLIAGNNNTVTKTAKLNIADKAEKAINTLSIVVIIFIATFQNAPAGNYSFTAKRNFSKLSDLFEDDFDSHEEEMIELRKRAVSPRSEGYQQVAVADLDDEPLPTLARGDMYMQQHPQRSSTCKSHLSALNLI